VSYRRCCVVAEYSYEDVDGYDYAQQQPLNYYDDNSVDDDAWQYDDDDDEYYDVEGRPKRDDFDSELYQNEADREAVRELLAERAAEEARQALIEYLTAGEPTYSDDEPQYLVDPSAEDLALEDQDQDQDRILLYNDAQFDFPVES